LPFARPDVDPAEEPDLDAGPEFELAPCPSKLLAGILSEVGLECWNPLFDLPLPIALVLLCAEKKCWFCDTPRVVDGAAARPLAEKLARLGLTGSLPVLNRAF
jgi:hypothetical protein